MIEILAMAEYRNGSAVYAARLGEEDIVLQEITYPRKEPRALSAIQDACLPLSAVLPDALQALERMGARGIAGIGIATAADGSAWASTVLGWGGTGESWLRDGADDSDCPLSCVGAMPESAWSTSDRWSSWLLRNCTYHQYLNSMHWNNTKERFRNRFSTCALCASRQNLHIHHRSYERRGGECDDDLMMLCKRCHHEFHEKIGLTGNGNTVWQTLAMLDEGSKQ